MTDNSNNDLKPEPKKKRPATSRYKVSAVTIAGDFQCAVINGKVTNVGDIIAKNAILQSVTNNHIVIAIGSKKFTVEVGKVFRMHK